MGGQVEEREDGLRIPGAQTLHGAELDSFGDHRIAMAFAVAALARAWRNSDSRSRVRRNFLSRIFSRFKKRRAINY